MFIMWHACMAKGNAHRPLIWCMEQSHSMLFCRTLNTKMSNARPYSWSHSKIARTLTHPAFSRFFFYDYSSLSLDPKGRFHLSKTPFSISVFVIMHQDVFSWRIRSKEILKLVVRHPIVKVFIPLEKFYF